MYVRNIIFPLHILPSSCLLSSYSLPLAIEVLVNQLFNLKLSKDAYLGCATFPFVLHDIHFLQLVGRNHCFFFYIFCSFLYLLVKEDKLGLIRFPDLKEISCNRRNCVRLFALFRSISQVMVVILHKSRRKLIPQLLYFIV